MMGDYPPCHSFLLSMPHRLYLRHQAGVVAQEGEETERHDVDDGLLVFAEINLSMNKDRVHDLVQQDERPPLRLDSMRDTPMETRPATSPSKPSSGFSRTS